MQKKSCFACENIKKIKDKVHPFFVAELSTGYVVIADYQYFKGYTLFICKEHKTELHQLDEKFKIKFLIEMSKVGEAVFNAFNAEQLNYELLGNGKAHLCWHIFPRKQGDAPIRGPVWWVDRTAMFAESVKPGERELKIMKTKLFDQLLKVTPLLSKGNF